MRQPRFLKSTLILLLSLTLLFALVACGQGNAVSSSSAIAATNNADANSSAANSVVDVATASGLRMLDLGTYIAETYGTGPFRAYMLDADKTSGSFEALTETEVGGVGGDFLTVAILPQSLLAGFPDAVLPADPQWGAGYVDHVAIYYGKISNFVWAVAANPPNAGSGVANVCTSQDGGKTWWIGDTAAMYSGTVTGAAFVSSEVGFMCYRYFLNQGPEIARTTDGGKTWTRIPIEPPEGLTMWGMTPLSPIFDGEFGRIPVELCEVEGMENELNAVSAIAFLVTTDGGMNWHWEENA